MLTLADKIISFNKNLTAPVNLQKDVGVLFPFTNKEVIKINEQFYKRYYADNSKRTLLLGINPGRFGAGITSIPFTDPVKLEQNCGIKNSFVKRVELSSDFIYAMIDSLGGTESFYAKFLISAVCPIGFVRGGKNLNYYDDKSLEKTLEPYIVDSLNQHLSFGINKDKCFCLGEGKNFKYLTGLNKKHNFFGQIIPLAHPRYIMQYKRKFLAEYIQLYKETLQ